MSFDEIDLYSGLAALHWSAYDDPCWDHDFYQRIVEEAGGLALDVACGAGRLLRSYLRAGLDVEGVDSSADMLAACRRKAEAEGLSPVLYCQPMQALDLPKRYDCIYIPCGSFTCVMGQENALEALRRFHAICCPAACWPSTSTGATGATTTTTPRKGASYPTEWAPHVTKDLDEERRLVIDRRTVGVDPVDQVVSEERRYRLIDGDALLQEETTPARTTGTSRRRCC